MKKIRAFTLIELLTVIAITAVLMTLIVLPLFQSFQVLRQGQALADAQDKGRLLVERIAREVGNAINVRSGAGGVSTTVNNTAATVSTTSLVITVPQRGGGVVETVLPESKLDLVPPAQGDPTRGPNGGYIDPISGKEDPTLTRPKGDINLSPRPGPTIVRWWIGLNRAVTENPNNPQAVPYNEPYTGLLMRRDGSRDNLYVLRRAEVQPYLPGGAVNTRFFRADATGRKIIDMDDPRFFIADGSDATKNQRVLAWQQASVVQTELSRYDMIRPVTTGAPATPVVTYDVNRVPGDPTTGIPYVLPLIQFRPTRVASSPATGSVAARPGQAVEGIDSIGPDTFQTTRGLWSNAVVRYYPAGYDPTNAAQSLMEVASASSNGVLAIGAGTSNGTGLDVPTGNAFFDISAYEANLAAGNPYPFTAAVINNAAWLNDATARSLFTPFRVLTATGKIVTSFPIEQLGTTISRNPDGSVIPNLPTVAIGNASSPTASSGTSAVLSPLENGYEINLAYNRIFNGDPDATGNPQQPLLQQYAQRFIDLRMVTSLDGTRSPLYPEATGGITGFTTTQYSLNSAGQRVDSGGYLNRVRITPGSESVYGPDQTTTGAYGNRVRYTRVTGNPGPNQYRLVYVDQPEPTNADGQIDYSAFGLNTTGFNAKAYDPTNIISAVIQPRYKAGYLQLCSDPNLPIPASGVPITVSYRFQLNGVGDAIAVDYDTREVMQILLTIKNYPQSSAPNPQVVTLSSTATLRNALR